MALAAGLSVEQVAEKAVVVRRRGGGRPSDLTPVTFGFVREALLRGASLRTAARVAGLKPDTVEKWFMRGRGRLEDRPATPEYVAFARMVEDTRATLHDRLGGYVIAGAAKDPNLALKLLERFDPEHWGPRDRIAIEEPEDLPALSPAIAQPPEAEEDEASSEPPTGSVTLRERTVTIPASRLDEFARLVRGDRKAKDGDGDEDLAPFHETADVPRP